MITPISALGFLGLLFLMVGALWWSRRHPHPCPWWMRRILENPYMRAVAGPAALIERIQLQPGMSVLDVGCGPGRLTIPFARHVGPQGRVTAFDVQEEMLRVVRDRLGRAGLDNVELVRGHAGEGEMRWDNVFDRAILVTVLGEIPNKPRALAEIHHALKPGGILSVTEVLPDPDYLSRHTVSRLTAEAGFQFADFHGNWLAFTVNVRKPVALGRPSASPETNSSEGPDRQRFPHQP